MGGKKEGYCKHREQQVQRPRGRKWRNDPVARKAKVEAGGEAGLAWAMEAKWRILFYPRSNGEPVEGLKEGSDTGGQEWMWGL